MKGFNQIAPILTKQITAIRLFTCAFTSSCNPSTYLTHGSRVCSASLISLCSSIGFTRSQVVAACLQSLRSLAVIGGLWRLFAVRLSMMCMRSGVYGLSFVLLCWVEGRCLLQTRTLPLRRSLFNRC